VGLDSWSARSCKAKPLILRRLFRLAFALSFGRAWAQKSPAWISVAGALLLFRFIDRRAAHAGRRADGAKPA
jgi:hypothetical protein